MPRWAGTLPFVLVSVMKTPITKAAIEGHHMKFEIIDLSAAIENDIASDPPGALPQVTYVVTPPPSSGWLPFPLSDPRRSAGRRGLPSKPCR